MNEQKYAISEYHDTNEVYAKQNRLIGQPLRPVRHEKMQEFLGYWARKLRETMGINLSSTVARILRAAAG